MPIATARSSRRNVSDLINQPMDWGLSVSEAVAEKSLGRKGMALAGYLGLAAAAFLVIPIIVGLTFFEASREHYLEIGIIVCIAGLAKYLDTQSRKGPKNALQIDYDASEVRLGSVGPTGAFIRHKVCPLRSIDSVSVVPGASGAVALKFEMFSETATLRFAHTDAERLAELAARIQAAADEARAAPIRSRIASRINGIEAGVREIGQRVRSRITTSFA